MCVEKKGESFTLGMIVGALAGVALGLVLAPASGEETRKKIKDNMPKYVEKGKAVYSSAQNIVSEVQEAAGPLMQEVEEKVMPILQKIQEASEPVREEVMEKIEQLTGDLEHDLGDKNFKKRFFRGVNFKK